jgi:hypothetical protein
MYIFDKLCPDFFNLFRHQPLAKIHFYTIDDHIIEECNTNDAGVAVQILFAVAPFEKKSNLKICKNMPVPMSMPKVMSVCYLPVSTKQFAVSI